MTKVELRSVICTRCNLPSTVNVDGLCSFCSRPQLIEQFDRAERTLAVLALIGLVAVIGFAVKSAWGWLL